MGNYLIDETSLKDIADAIRTKNRDGSKLKVSDMPQKILAIAGGVDSDELIDRSVTSVISEIEEIGPYAFASCFYLATVDLSNTRGISGTAFQNCRSLKAVILRSETLCQLGSTGAFNNCNHILGIVHNLHNPNGDKDGYFYVPKALLSNYDSSKDYRRATNWSEFSTQFRALEDYTIDGTIWGRLDPEKVANGVQPDTPDVPGGPDTGYEWLFEDEYIDTSLREGLPSLSGTEFIGKTFTLVVHGIDIVSKVYEGLDSNDQFSLKSVEYGYELVYQAGGGGSWFTPIGGFTCSVRIDKTI